MRHSEKCDLGISAPFQHKYPFQYLKTKNPFPRKKLKSKKKLRDQLKNHRKNNQKKKMDHKQYNLEELYGMLDKERNPEGLNKIMSVIVDK